MATLSSDKTYVTVVKGDTLSQIALDYKSYIAGSDNAARIQTLVKVNDITDPDFIVVGQKIYFAESGSSSSGSKNTTSTATIKAFGLQSNTDRTVYATWKWDKNNTDHYEVKWFYSTGDDVTFIGEETTTKNKQHIYNAPANATVVAFRVKPVSKKKKVNGKETSYWTADWSTTIKYKFSDNPPTKPPVPTVKIEKYQLTATLDNLNVNADGIQFQVVKDNNSKVFASGKATISTGHASYSCAVDAGGEYKVRCRSYRDDMYSDWSEYSTNISTMPAASSGITTIKATSETSVFLEWSAAGAATSYTLEYATKKEYLGSSDGSNKVTDIKETYYEKIGLESGEEYFFRVRAVNTNGESAWSDVVSIVLGTDPAAPTTWSSSTTVKVGEKLILYWVHNSEDGSSQTYAELELIVDGHSTTDTIQNTANEDEKDKTSSYEVDTKDYAEGTTLEWRVRTAGVTKVYGDWSVLRKVDIYSPPTLSLNVTNASGTNIDRLTSFPLYISAKAGPDTQEPIGYHVAISAKEAYETVDQVGNTKVVGKGEEVYSKYFDTSDELVLQLSANHVDLHNNITYIVSCTVTMDSGLNCTASDEFTVAWTDISYEPNAEVGADMDTMTVHIRPYCEDENGNLINGVTLSVYRREFDGSFVELATGLDNTQRTFITDPHPALDYARYRIVATTESTGAVSYYDLPGYPIGGKAVVIQWDEDWTSFHSSSEEPLERPAWNGSLLKLPYNIDVSDKYAPDVARVSYIGRKRPVAYYGTQLGESSTWKVDIPANDIETLYALRRLAIWMGNVYVREPSGSGYWANINVSFSQTHMKLVIPVTLEIVRVEGGA